MSMGIYYYRQFCTFRNGDRAGCRVQFGVYNLVGARTAEEVGRTAGAAAGELSSSS